MKIHLYKDTKKVARLQHFALSKKSIPSITPGILVYSSAAEAAWKFKLLRREIYAVNLLEQRLYTCVVSLLRVVVLLLRYDALDSL